MNSERFQRLVGRLVATEKALSDALFVEVTTASTTGRYYAQNKNVVFSAADEAADYVSVTVLNSDGFKAVWMLYADEFCTKHSEGFLPQECFAPLFRNLKGLQSLIPAAVMAADGFVVELCSTEFV